MSEMALLLQRLLRVKASKRINLRAILSAH
jgi:hypothetical protein